MARLPVPGGDRGNWGHILNEYLSESLSDSGTLKAGSVGIDQIVDQSVTTSKLALAVQDKLNTEYTPLPEASLNPLTGVWYAEGYGAIAGSADSAPGINAAITAATNAGGGTVFINGAHTVRSPIYARSNVTLMGANRQTTRITPGISFSPAVVLGSSGNTVSRFQLRNLTIDGNFSTIGGSINGVQITNGSFISIEDCEIINFGNSLILLGGIGTGGGTPDSVIRNNILRNGGLSDGTTGFGVMIKDASKRCVTSGNRIDGIKGGMGVGLVGSAGTGYPTNNVITDNIITMAPSTTGFEAIGIAIHCVETVISNNNITDSEDNGISVTADRCTVTGNIIDGVLNHGIASAGSGTTIVSNFIRNIGKLADADYGGISLAAASYNTVGFNRIVDDQTVSTTTSGVKFVTSLGNNLVAFNQISGQTGSAYTSPALTDVIFDANANTGGISATRFYADSLVVKTAGQSLLFGSTAQAQGQFLVGSTGGAPGQLTVHTNTIGRPSAALVNVPSQTADLLTGYASDGTTILGGMTRTGRVYSNDGVTSKDLGNITGLTSAQIDGLFTTTPPNGTYASATLSSASVIMLRHGGKWMHASATIIS